MLRDFLAALTRHRPWLRRAALVSFACAAGGALAASPPNTPLTLEQAWQQAEAANPKLRSSRAALMTAEGRLADVQAPLWNNPRLSAQQARRKIPPAGLPGQTVYEWSTGIEQTFEIAGQQGYRRHAAEEGLAALQENLNEIQRQVRSEAERRFVEVLALQLRVDTERQALKLIENAAAVIARRVTAGEDTRLDGNLAAVEADRARNQLTGVREQLIQARANLAALLQLPQGELPKVIGELVGKQVTYTLDQLLANAAQRPGLRAAAHREQAARSRLQLERAQVYPDVTVGLFTAREAPGEARESVIGLTVSLPLPLFRRNATGIGQAATELTQAEIERQRAARDAAAAVAALWQKAQSLRARVKALQDSVLPRLDDNQRLSLKSLRAGEIGLAQLILVNRQLLDGRRDLLDAQTEWRLTRIALEQAAGWSSDTAVADGYTATDINGATK